jgi:hypothetical protein
MKINKLNAIFIVSTAVMFEASERHTHAAADEKGAVGKISLGGSNWLLQTLWSAKACGQPSHLLNRGFVDLFLLFQKAR